MKRVIEMKIGIGVQDYFRWNEKKYEKLKSHGYSCVDFRMMDITSFPYNSSMKEAEERLLKEKKAASDSGIEIYQVHGPWTWPPESQDSTIEKRNKKFEDVKKSLWATAVLECKNWVIHPIMPCGIHDKNDNNQDTTLKVNIEFMNKVLEIGKEYGINICLENMPMPNFSIATPYEILDFVNLINDDNFKICLDTGHVATFPDISAAQAVRDLGDKISAFHIHDSHPNADLHLWPYFGRTDWKDFSKALKEINYSGGLCLETSAPGNLPDEIFEDLCIDLAKIIKTIAD